MINFFMVLTNYLLVCLLFGNVFLYSLDFEGIVGGQDQNSLKAYAGTVSFSDTVDSFFPFPVPTEINAVGINDLGVAIVGGSNTLTGKLYAAFILPSGKTVSISGLADVGNVINIAINNRSLVVLGGRKNLEAYAVLISSSGDVTTVSGLPSTGTINGVAINDSGTSIIGGTNLVSGAMYAAFISSTGGLTPISGLLSSGSILKADINENGVSVVGGVNADTDAAYAAFVSSSGSVTSLSGVPSNGFINDVGINNSGKTIIGGRDFDTLAPYVAFAFLDGTTSAISGFPALGNITSVDINASGVSIVGGQNAVTGGAYSALISPSGELSPVANLPSFGLIESVAISDTGIALIGGSDSTDSSAYAALVSPSGMATKLPNLPSKGNITSVDILRSIIPSSFGPGSSFADSLFIFSSQTLSNHLTSHILPEGKDFSLEQELELLAEASEISFWRKKQKLGEKKEEAKSSPQKAQYVVWGSSIGSYLSEKKGTPKYKNKIGGILVGFDFLDIPNTVIGSAVAYAYSHVDLFKETGKANTHQEFLSFYTAWETKHFSINGSLWGGFYQMKNERVTLENITSLSHIKGGLFSMHLQTSFPFWIERDWCFMSPFAMADWVHNWQGEVEEKGISGINLFIEDQYTSLLRSETGFQFFEVFAYTWGNFVLEEKISWVNKLPVHAKKAEAFFIGSPSSFSIGTFSGKTENLGAISIRLLFDPAYGKYPYGAFSYQGEFSSSQAHTISLEIGKKF